MQCLFRSKPLISGQKKESLEVPGSFIERGGKHPDLYTNDKMEQTTHLAKGSQTNERPRPVTMRHFLKILNAHVEAYLRYAFLPVCYV